MSYLISVTVNKFMQMRTNNFIIQIVGCEPQMIFIFLLRYIQSSSQFLLGICIYNQMPLSIALSSITLRPQITCCN